MRAVMSDVSPDILAWRQRTGADRWDEMWEGVLHMPPMPNREHQDLEWSMETYLRRHWVRPQRTRVFHGINVASPGGWPHNYRIPDLVLVTAERLSIIDRNEYFDGGPEAVVEILSPGDESYEKLGFYAELGVLEVWIIERDSKQPELYMLRAGHYEQQAADPEGWLHSMLTGIELRRGRPGKLAMRVHGDKTTYKELPED
jgi:Uma2 family endonuclease